MSSNQLPKIPDRPVRRRRTADEIGNSGSTSPSRTPPVERISPVENVKENDKITEVPVIPSRRPFKSQTTTDFPSVPSLITPLHAKRSTEPDLWSTAETKLSTGDKDNGNGILDDIVQSTNQQLEEMKKLIKKQEGPKEADIEGVKSAQDTDVNISKQSYNESKAVSPVERINNVEEVADSPNISQSFVSESIAPENDDEVNKVLETNTQTKPLSVDDQDAISQSCEKQKVDSDIDGIEIIKSKEHSIPSIPKRPARASNMQQENQYESCAEAKDVTGSTSRPSKENEGDENISQPDTVIQDTDSISITESSSESKESLSDSTTTKKRTAPPVPKKPSSRIAAFQEMLQKQQLEQIQRLPTVTGTKNSTNTDTPNLPRDRPMHHDQGRFTQNLNGIFTPAGPLTQSNNSSLTNNKIGSEQFSARNEKSLNDVRHHRARGPKGRKLPSNVSNVQKITSQVNTNEIEIFNTWSIIHTKERKSRMKPQYIISSRRELPVYLSDSVEGLINAGIQERRPSLSMAQISERPLIESELQPVINEVETYPPDKVEETPEKVSADMLKGENENEEIKDLKSNSICAMGNNEAKFSENEESDSQFSDEKSGQHD